MTPMRVALVGFSEFEQSALGSVFRLAAPGCYRQVRGLVEADVIVADADRPAVIAGIESAWRTTDTLFIGSRAPAQAAGWLPRPIDALQLLRGLDALVAARAPVAPARHQPPAPPPAPAAASDSGFMPLDEPSADEAPAPSALIVDDSAVARRFLQGWLRQLGVQSALAGDSAAALELAARHRFEHVFIDVELGEASPLDGLALCQRLRRDHDPAHGRAPVLVIVSAHHAELDRARGAFAGCDHYLAKPIDRAALARLFNAAPAAG